MIGYVPGQGQRRAASQLDFAGHGAETLGTAGGKRDPGALGAKRQGSGPPDAASKPPSRWRPCSESVAARDSTPLFSSSGKRRVPAARWTSPNPGRETIAAGRGSVPEYPDVELYCSAVEARIVGARLSAFRIASPHLLASVEPSPDALIGRLATGVHRIGKQLVMEFEENLFCAVHLAVAGRFHWTANPSAGKPARLSPRGNLAVWTFESGPGEGGHLRLVERSPKKRASIRVGQGPEQLWGGSTVAGSRSPVPAARRSLPGSPVRRSPSSAPSPSPPGFAGVGNAYSDEILWHARLSPTKRAGSLTTDQIERLHSAAEAILTEWATRPKEECGSAFPTGVTAFREGMAVHGRFGQPCPVCGSPVQRVRRAENEFNYCATCQTGGKLLADRAMSRLLRKKWPRTLKAAEERRRRLALPASGPPPEYDLESE